MSPRRFVDSCQTHKRQSSIEVSTGTEAIEVSTGTEAIEVSTGMEAIEVSTGTEVNFHRSEYWNYW